MRTRALVSFLTWLALSSVLAPTWAGPAVEEGIPDYRPLEGISGNLSSIGSDTLANLMTLWAEAFQHLYPGVNLQIQAAGSSTAPPALSEGTAGLGPMSRPMRPGEQAAFEAHHGYPPTPVRVAIDTLAVYVHQDNPIRGLTLSQLDALFSITLRCGAEHPLRRWGELGLDGSWQRRGIQLFGRNSASGTYGFFKRHALCGGDFRPQVNEQPGSASVVQAVSSTLDGIGYSGIGYRTSGVRSVPLAWEAGGPFVEADAEGAVSGRYPLSRYLYLYVNRPPGRPLPPLEREFLKLVLSRTGQTLVHKDGYIPLPAAEVAKELAKLQ